LLPDPEHEHVGPDATRRADRLRHHERFDGTGYPDALAGNAIPVEAQVVSISDVFDALTTARAYKPAWTNEKAIAYIREQAGRCSIR